MTAAPTKGAWAVLTPCRYYAPKFKAVRDIVSTCRGPELFHTRKDARAFCKEMNKDRMGFRSSKFHYTYVYISFFYNLNRGRCS